MFFFVCVCVGLKLGLKLEKIESFKSTSRVMK